MPERINKELYDTFKGLVFEAIQTYASANKQINLVSAVAQEQLTTHILTHTHTFIAECEDEIDSLWFMLDEMKGAEDTVKSLDFKERIDKMVNEHVVLLKMMQNSKGDA